MLTKFGFHRCQRDASVGPATILEIALVRKAYLLRRAYICVHAIKDPPCPPRNAASTPNQQNCSALWQRVR